MSTVFTQYDKAWGAELFCRRETLLSELLEAFAGVDELVDGMRQIPYNGTDDFSTMTNERAFEGKICPTLSNPVASNISNAILFPGRFTA